MCGSFVGFNEWPKKFSDVVVASPLGQQHVGSAALRTHEREPVLQLRQHARAESAAMAVAPSVARRSMHERTPFSRSMSGRRFEQYELLRPKDELDGCVALVRSSVISFSDSDFQS